MSIEYIEGLLESCGAFVDIAKLPGLSLRLQPKDYLSKKIELYKKHDMRVFGGGMMLEAALICHHVDTYLAQAKEIGISLIEVSESETRMVPATKLKLIELCKGKGFEVTAELGPHGATQPYEPRDVIATSKKYLQAGAWKIILEADVITLMKPWENYESAEKLRSIIDEIGFENFIFEIGDNIKDAQWFILNYGPEVNIAINQGAVSQIPEGIMKLEHMRRGVLFPETWFGSYTSL
jgi:phosphosulfolactate synthase (CoM biosynthesis protein A)